ncbi:ATP-binding protein [Streptomyces sp. NPDC021100]|uniref:ATP-binding protein n=1 Tax=Streptomyces sp. NPDC021100 TaxID=3365114 RepID=UPI0037A8B891
MDQARPAAETPAGPHDGGQRPHTDQAGIPCPYPGLAPFHPDQAQWFFGREELLTRLINHMDKQQRSGGLMAVVGPRGVGKSSLLAAGLLPALAAGAIPGADHTPHLLFSPSEHPMKALAAHLGSLAHVAPDSLAEALARDPEGGAEILRETVPPRTSGDATHASLVLVVDQLEELFTLCWDEQERHDFLGSLCALAKQGPDGYPPVALVVCGLSSKYFARCYDYPAFGRPLRHLVGVEPMSDAQLREAITLPARAVGLQVESGLTELLLRDLAGVSQASRLPLLAHALRQTWMQQQGQQMTVAAYQASGGIQGAVAATAESVFTQLDPPEQMIARRLLLQLIRVGGDIQPTRRHVDITALVGRNCDTASAVKVLDAFTQAYVFSEDKERVEIAHEALLWTWPRLREWLSDDRLGNRFRQHIEDAAATWRGLDRAPHALFRGTALAAARSWPGRHDLSPLATEFLDASARRKHHTTKLLMFPALALITGALLTASLLLLMRALPAAHGWWSLGIFFVLWAVLAVGWLLITRSYRAGIDPPPKAQSRIPVSRSNAFLDGLLAPWTYQFSSGAAPPSSRASIRQAASAPSIEQSRRNVEEALSKKYGLLGAPPQVVSARSDSARGGQSGDSEGGER